MSDLSEMKERLTELEHRVTEAYKQGYIDGQIQVYQDMRKHLEAKHEIRHDPAPKQA